MTGGKHKLPGEFELIAKYFAPLAGSESAFGLTDDAAVLTPAPGHQTVITKDLMIAGVHFPANDPAEQVARKLLRVNLSDLAAMGAEPVGYFLGLALADDIDEPWLRKFTDGLRADQDSFGLSMLGGDTVSTGGPVCLSLTAVGEVPQGKALLRAGACVGDSIWLSGHIGDAYIGLHLASGEKGWRVSQEDADYFIQRFRLPEPRLRLGAALRDVAHAAIDVSDGLIADLAHICRSSGVGAVLHSDDFYSDPARRLIEQDRNLLDRLRRAGDDYELIFTAPPEATDNIHALSQKLDLTLAKIGEIVGDDETAVRDRQGRNLGSAGAGYTHF